MKQDKYEFRKIRTEEISIMFDMILERMKWMDEVGIHQWNETAYDKVYPYSYFVENMDCTYVLIDHDLQQIVCAGTLYETDERWTDNPDWHGEGNAVYLHHLVTRTDIKNTGKIYLQYAEETARSRGFDYFRLDSAVGNEKLEKFYEDFGFEPVGQCIDGPYIGVLREKKLKNHTT